MRPIAMVIAATAVFLANFKRNETKAAIKATVIQTNLFANNYFGASLLAAGFSEDTPEWSLDIGYLNEMQMKIIYLSRYLFRDQFLFQSWEHDVHSTIANRLGAQYEKNGWDESTLTTAVPTVEWDSISTNVDKFFNDFVKPGKVVVVRHVPSKAVTTWSTDYFAAQYGDHLVDVINTSSVRPVPSMKLADFVSASKSESLYLRSLSDIFDVHEELLDDVGHRNFDDHLKGQYMTAQIFMGSKKPGSGTSYHCANFNNLFFMVQGRKKWTFVDPNYEVLMYPMFNAKAMDVASFVTTVALANATMMKEHFPLYSLAPKTTITLEPGDVLFNPPWNWHMVENVDSESIGVATRWFLAPGQAYQNSVHSTLQW